MGPVSVAKVYFFLMITNGYVKDARRWTLDAGHWTLDARHWT